MSIFVATVLAAVVNAAPSMPALEPAQRDSQCLIALGAEAELGPLQEQAKSFFDAHLKKGRDPELVELLVISAEESILPNTNRRAIASTCLVLYQVLRLQEKQGAGN